MHGKQIKFFIWQIREFDKIGVDKIEDLLCIEFDNEKQKSQINNHL